MKMFSGQTLSLEKRERQLEEELILRMMEGVYEGSISGGEKNGTMSRGIKSRAR